MGVHSLKTESVDGQADPGALSKRDSSGESADIPRRKSSQQVPPSHSGTPHEWKLSTGGASPERAVRRASLVPGGLGKKTGLKGDRRLTLSSAEDDFDDTVRQRRAMQWEQDPRIRWLETKTRVAMGMSVVDAIKRCMS